MKTGTLLSIIVATILSANAAHAADAAVKCESDKLKTAGKYDSCRLNVDAKAVSKGVGVDYSKCALKYGSKWASIEAKGAGACPTSGDQASIDSVVSDHQAAVLLALTPGGPPLTSAGMKCAGAKLKAAGKHDSCRLSAEAKGVKTGSAPDFSKCGPKLTSSFAKAEATGGGDCPTSGDAGSVTATANLHTDNVALLLSGIGATSCPAAFRLTTRPGFGTSTSNATRIETGTPGLVHMQDLPTGASMTIAVASCANATPPCGDCTLQGVDASYLGRCSNDVTTSCNELDAADFDDCGGAICDYPLWGAPRHVSASSTSLCVVQHLASDIAGSVNNETGASELEIASRHRIYLGTSQARPCPVCEGDAIANDGIRNGTCSGGDRDGLMCDANGGDATFGATSLDCPPDPGANITGAGLPRATLLSTAGDSHGFGVPCDSPLAFLACPCAVCTGDTSVACSSNGDCAALAAGTCTTNGPGSTRRPNNCDDDTCVAAGGGTGECTAGPADSYCDGLLRANGEPLLTCVTNGDCDSVCDPFGACGDCTLSRFRPCFLDPIVATGVSSPTAPTLAGVDCQTPSGSAAINIIFGLPGPERSTVQLDLSRIY